MEPSGLVLSHCGKALWTISDDTKRIFKLSLDGKLKKKSSFKIEDKELEGMTLESTGQFFYVVKEGANEIIKIDTHSFEVLHRSRLSIMENYDSIAHFFDNGFDNKGLEGISYHPQKGNLFLLKEGKPGLLIEISIDLKTIVDYRELNESIGFIDTRVDQDELDFSDISYDSNRDCFWIISDKAKRLFLYNYELNFVVQSCTLGYAHKGKYKEVEKAEGVAINRDSNRLYIVSDEEAKLYIYDIRH